jgi:hypothetical protein
MVNTFDLIEHTMRYESGDLNIEEITDLFQYLIDTGLAWELQGTYGRTAVYLVECGVCLPARRWYSPERKEPSSQGASSPREVQ